ncbi:hypothetical protein OC861_006792, partial [Tilletia horrida]
MIQLLLRTPETSVPGGAAVHARTAQHVPATRPHASEPSAPGGAVVHAPRTS